MKWLSSSTALAVLFAASSGSAQAPSPTPARTFDEKTLKGVDTSNRVELSDEEIQKQFFKKKGDETEVSELFLPFFYERMERALGRVKSRVSLSRQQTAVEVDARAILHYFDELVIEDFMARFKPMREQCAVKPDDACWVPLSRFDDADVKLSFDQRALELRLVVPGQFRTKKTESLFSRASMDNVEVTDQPSFFSTFINANMTQEWRSDNVTTTGDSRGPLRGHFDSGTRFGPIAIDANARYLEPTPGDTSPSPLVREDVRAVLDFPEARVRAFAGDLVYPVRGYQNFRPILGVAAFRYFNLQSSKLTLPGGSYEVNLQRPSKVMVFINDQLVQVLDLAAGRHDLRDFPFNSGLNDLRLEILDDLGRTESQSYTYFSSNELLQPGLNEFSYAVGSPWTEVNTQRVYDQSNVISSLSHRLGLTQNLTLGANVQNDTYQTIVGLESLMSTPVGYFAFEPAYSVNAGRDSGYAARLRFIRQSYVGKERRARFYTIEASTISDSFAQLGNRTQINPVAAKLGLVHSRAISKRAGFNASGEYRLSAHRGTATENSFAVSLGFSHRWSDGLSTNLGFRHQKAANGAEDLSVTGFLIWAFPEDQQFVTASHDSSSKTTRADWTYQPSNGVDGFQTKANVESKELSSTYGGAFDYTANRARVQAAHQIDVQKVDPNANPPQKGNSVNITTVNLATALVYAGGHFGISRSVTDSFAILAPLENLDGQNVKVNEMKNGTYVAETDWLGPAVHPELSSYSVAPLSISQKDLKIGTAIPRDHFMVRPTYHSGYAIEIGTDAVVYLTAQLNNPKGEPAAMLAAQAVYLDKEGKESVTVFTNRSGLVRSEGFRPGRYRLEFADDDFAPFEFTIPSGTGAQFDLGSVQIKARSK